MSSNTDSDGSRLKRFLRPMFLLKTAGVLVVVVVLYSLLFGGGSGTDASATTFEVRRRNLPITVLAGGSAMSENPTSVKCEVKGRGGVKILTIVEEGYRVTKEDIEDKKVLVELDSADLEELIMQQEIQYQNALAALSKAKQDYEIQEKQNETDIEAAKREARFKALDLKKYLGETVAEELIEELHRRRDVEAAGKAAREAHQAVQQARQAVEEKQVALAKANADAAAKAEREAARAKARQGDEGSPFKAPLGDAAKDEAAEEPESATIKLVREAIEDRDKMAALLRELEGDPAKMMGIMEEARQDQGLMGRFMQAVQSDPENSKTVEALMAQMGGRGGRRGGEGTGGRGGFSGRGGGRMGAPGERGSPGRGSVDALVKAVEEAQSTLEQAGTTAQETAEVFLDASKVFREYRVFRAENRLRDTTAIAQETARQAAESKGNAEGSSRSVDLEQLEKAATEAAQARTDATRALAVRKAALEATAAEGQDNPAEFNVTFEPFDYAGLAYDSRLGGQAEQERKTLESDIILGRLTLMTAEKKLKGTQNLYANDFATEMELEGDQLDVKQNRIRSESRITTEELFFRYEFPKEAEEAFSEYQEALTMLDRVIKETQTKLLNAEVNMGSAEARYNVEYKQRADYNQQAEKCTIYAETEGLIVYGGSSRRHSSRDPVGEGAMVNEQQTMLTIPDITQMAIEVKIHETEIKKVKVGQKATIRVEAFADLVLEGEVTKVSVLPNSEDRWLSPDLKVYKTTVSVEGVHEWLKPGMTAEVEIAVKNLENVFYVPLQAVSSHGGERVCYLANEDRRVVETGEFSDKYIEIKSGLEEGDRILLRPLEGDKEDEGAEEEAEQAPDSELAAGGTAA